MYFAQKINISNVTNCLFNRISYKVVTTFGKKLTGIGLYIIMIIPDKK